MTWRCMPLTSGPNHGGSRKRSSRYKSWRGTGEAVILLLFFFFMPIASKLVYFQRRRPSPAPPEPEPEPPDPRRRPCRGGAGASAPRRRSSLSHHHHHHHKPGQEHVPGSKRDTAKCVASAGNITEQAGSTGSSSRLNRSVSDHGRLPDSVQQARERLLQRLNSVDLSGRRQNTSLSSATIHAGVAPVVSSTADSIFVSLTSCFHTDVSIAPCKLQESTPKTFNTADKHTLITHCSEPAPTQEVSSCGGTNDDELTEPSVECSICLERCGDADGLLELQCKHIFHSACLERWLRSRSDCPYCRASVLLTSEG
uniref:RING-type domain-containing protein n=1 Tax=Oryza punctata TaxID=4537 RepID=A0A0E0MP09_ORYPU